MDFPVLFIDFVFGMWYNLCDYNNGEVRYDRV